MIKKISGPVVFGTVDGKINDLVRVGKQKLLGEIIEIRGDEKVIQVYEDTTGLKPTEPIVSTKKPLSVDLGPGLLGSVYDGTQRPLDVILKTKGIYVPKGVEAPALRDEKWEFTPTLKNNETVTQGQIIGEVKENSFIHKILVPIGIEGKISGLKKGKYKVTEEIGKVGDTPIYLKQSWPVRKPRPTNERLKASEPLISGQRVLDFMFPVSKGGVAAIPGPFGAGKTVTQQQFAKWCDADVIVYIGCGERGNEMTEILREFPHLKDPRTKEPLMNRTVLVANTSNMPVAARESSVYTGITIAEYFRDQGYKVALMADSTSRWAEAMREISGRLEEMPGEEGFPAYLSKRLSEFYERAGNFKTLSGENGNITVIGAVSPPGGDFSEPVTQNTLRIVRAFWALDAKLADKRHYPSIDWLQSYSLYQDNVKEWFNNKYSDWSNLREETEKILQQEASLQEIVQLVGLDSLPKPEQLLLLIAKTIREDFLQQNAFSEEDTYCTLEKQYVMIKAIHQFFEEAKDKDLDLEKLRSSKIITKIAGLKYETDVTVKDLKELQKISVESIKQSM
jgi:V/A-type H+/Na+-transporting ATPase subunit A